MNNNWRDDHFKTFIGSLEAIITGHGDNNTTARQKAQVERLVRLEKEFRKALIKHHWGKFVYQDFISYILDNNILEARPFFRERNPLFTGFEDENKKNVRGIADCLRKRSYRGLYRFDVNFRFIKFAMNARKWRSARSGGVICKIYDEIVAARTELVEMNMPLAISQARIFFQKTQKSHLTYMDYVQIAAEGLIAAIDKFCLPYTTVFRTVATHRMRGNFIDENSQTPIHFYPKDRRRLYQAFKYIKQKQGQEYQLEELVKEINKKLKPSERTTVEEMADLLGASKVVSAHSMPVVDAEETGMTVLETHADAEDKRPDVKFENVEMSFALREALSKLSVFERKLLRMKGIEFTV